MSRPLIADTGGLLRALARARNGKPAWPDYEAALVSASLVVVPALVLAEVDYFLRTERAAMRALVAEIFDPSTTYDFELSLPADRSKRSSSASSMESSPPSQSADAFRGY
jgi:hypothetical protein